MANNPATALGVGQIRMSCNMALDFRFNRLGKQLPRTGPQNVCQRIISSRLQSKDLLVPNTVSASCTKRA